ncbi:hypothetical protein HZ326_26959 [Fusarium oxysporum f. sp. albedinis]|nr:hypothetical protein HZ326_26959 [Fusarium oxysporum f. sp. albedinis]
MLGVVETLKVVRTYLKQNPTCHILTITSIAPSPPHLVTMYAKVISWGKTVSEDLMAQATKLKTETLLPGCWTISSSNH